jgi:hypothetical protein
MGVAGSTLALLQASVQPAGRAASLLPGPFAAHPSIHDRSLGVFVSIVHAISPGWLIDVRGNKKQDANGSEGGNGDAEELHGINSGRGINSG